MLANLIEKYAAVLDIDNLPEPPNCLGKETAGATNISEQPEDTIEKTKTARYNNRAIIVQTYSERASE